MASYSPASPLTFTLDDVRRAFDSLGLNRRQQFIADHHLDGLEKGYPADGALKPEICEIIHIAFGIAQIPANSTRDEAFPNHH